MMTVGATWPGRLRPNSPSITAPDTSTPYIITGTPGRPGTTITGSFCAAAGSAAKTVAIRLPASTANIIRGRARIGLSETDSGSLVQTRPARAWRGSKIAQQH